MLTVRLEGYNATVDQNADLFLGTWDSYGIEKIQIVPGTEWENLTITATFVTVYGSTVVVVPPNGLIGVPYEATCKSGMFLGGGRIVFSGVSEGIRRISTDICYSVKDHSPISGEEPEPTPGMWEQFVARVEDSASSAEENAKSAKTSADNALKSAENASLSEKNAQSSAASAKSSEDSAKKSAEIAYNLSQGAWEQFVDQVEESAESAKKDAEKAGVDAKNAESNAALSQSFAVGGTGVREGEDTNNARYWCEEAQKVAQGALGWYETEEALRAAHPTGQNGQWAIVGNTNTIWTWDSDTEDWTNTAPQANASTLGMVKIHDTPDGNKTAAGGWAASPAAVQAVSADIYMVRTYAQYSASNPRLLVVAIDLPSGINAGINQFAVSVEVENEVDAAYQHFVQISSNRASVYFRKADGSSFSNGNVVWFNAIVVVNR